MARRNQLVMKAMEAAFKVRRDTHLGLREPACVYDLAREMGVDVRFTSPSSMEGLYCKSNSVIFVSALRPAGRQAYTCAHELGHHVFGHGSILVDELYNIPGVQNKHDPQETLADMFAGFLLMPKSAVEHAFAVRGWNPHFCTSLQVYTVACLLGVGYTTLLNHMAHTLRLISGDQARALGKISLSAIRAEYLQRAIKENLIIVDEHWPKCAIDVQVGDLIQLPANVQQGGDFVRFQEDNSHGRLFCATRQGQGCFSHPMNGWVALVRVARKNFTGRALYRHLEDPDDN